MKNRWLPVIVPVILVTLISTGCGVPTSQYDVVADELNQVKQDRQALQTQLQEAQSQFTSTKTDLQNVQAQVQSLQNDLTAARNIPAQALSYAEFMDILMYEFWIAEGVTPNFTFSTAGEYVTALKNRAASIGDAQLISFVAGIETGPADKSRLYNIFYYCLDKLETILK